MVSEIGRDCFSEGLLPENASLIVFHVFFISDLYLAKVIAKKCCFAARRLAFSIGFEVNAHYFIISRGGVC